MDAVQLRAQLEAELDTLVRRQSKIEAHLHNTDHEPPKDWSELATFRENDEVLDHLDAHTRARVRELSAALARMNTDDWGICSRCEGDIGLRRLEVLPTTALCVRCAEAAE